MKKTYLILFSLFILLFFLVGLSLIKIPSPQKLINEEYELNIK